MRASLDHRGLAWLKRGRAAGQGVPCRPPEGGKQCGLCPEGAGFRKARQAASRKGLKI